MAGKLAVVVHAMRPWVSVAAATVGLGAATASLLDHLSSAPSFCSASGCETVRESAWSHPAGIPMPVFGVAFFAAAVALPVLRTLPNRTMVLRAFAVVGALVAAFLIGVQAFAIGAWCKLCLVSDLAALAYAGATLAGGRLAVTPRMALASVPGALVAMLVLRANFAAPAEPEPTGVHLAGVPDVVAREQSPDAVTLVEFTDFECPFCRKMAARLDQAVAQSNVPVRVVRKMTPLVKLHPHAMTAAVAYCCAELQGKGEQMAALLYAADPADLTPGGCEHLAAQAGCDLARFRADRQAAGERVDRDLADAQAAGVGGLPTLYINTQKIVGAKLGAAELADLITLASRSRS